MDENQATQGTEQGAPKKKKKSGRHLSLAAQLAALEQRQKELAAKRREVKAQINVRERKARAHRLIEVGAVVEAVLGAQIPRDALPRLEAFLRANRDGLGAALGQAAQREAGD